MITVLLFAQLQEVVGKERIQVDASELTVTELKEKLKSKYNIPQVDQVMTAINEEYALPDDLITSGDIVALIPPVSGG
ncbi:molybdopterin converting factor subunit 1 [Ornithinibacillus halotolerans]|uniref:Molybdopterin synthase sulfur carrier subunit n=1 Tax=Ornithinibacillus halotolerans TaxID=1274357 RepID=A0A916S2L3_9BACI|nr:molybdopterin converting factor subunit 1 [Ornithinibacillus halotolerans]GGA81007.1 molybdopterin synthase sulfur carrier subunit [Ornithinibacillus halotolerans]